MLDLENYYRWTHMQDRNNDTDVETDIWSQQGKEGWAELGD